MEKYYALKKFEIYVSKSVYMTKVTFMYWLEVGQGYNSVPGADALHHVVTAVLSSANQRNRPHLS